MSENLYLLRFDDICPTMNWTVWEAIERQLVLHNLRPILAVVPDNRDPNLMYGPPVLDFWDRVRKWQEMGYAIAVHGYQHVYVNEDPGMLGLTRHSEFAGLSYQEQEAKLKSSLAIFSEQGVRPDLWVAPSHSFDRTTMRVLGELGVKVISDGMWSWPHKDDDDFFWVPQQLWDFQPRPAGVWTVCNHHNLWSEERMANFEKNLAFYAPKVSDLPTILRTYADRALTRMDRVNAWWEFMFHHRIKNFFAGILPLFIKARRRR